MELQLFIIMHLFKLYNDCVRALVLHHSQPNYKIKNFKSPTLKISFKVLN